MNAPTRKHNTPRSAALPVDRTSDWSGIRTRNPKVVKRMRYQLNHTRCTVLDNMFFKQMCILSVFGGICRRFDFDVGRFDCVVSHFAGAQLIRSKYNAETACNR